VRGVVEDDEVDAAKKKEEGLHPPAGLPVCEGVPPSLKLCVGPSTVPVPEPEEVKVSPAAVTVVADETLGEAPLGDGDTDAVDGMVGPGEREFIEVSVARCGGGEGVVVGDRECVLTGELESDARSLVAELWGEREAPPPSRA